MEKPIFFALRTTAAALLALTSADALGINHPWWAAMTVWLVAQPTRGLLLERAMARLTGSAVGAAAGAAVLLGLKGQPLPSLLALALWLAFCAGLGSMFRHFRNYGVVLAGYTASIVVMFGLGDGVHNGDLAVDRVLCTIAGIVCSALASIYAVPKASGERLSERLEDVLQRCLARVEQHLRHKKSSLSAQTLIADIAALDHSVDNEAAGSLRGRRNALRVRQISGLLLELIALTPEEGEVRDVVLSRRGTDKEWVASLSQLSKHLDQVSKRVDQAGVAQVLDELLAVLRQPPSIGLGNAFRNADMPSVMRAGVRPVIALAVSAVIWQSTGWQTGAMMVMTATLFASLFSAHDQGNQALIQVLIGSLLGALGGLMVRLFLLPHAQGLWTVLLCIAPFLLLGAWLMRRPSTAKMAIDLNMTFLLTAQPGSPPAEVAMVLNESSAIIVGVLVAVATYWLFLPATPQVRQRLLARRIVRLADTVSQAPDAMEAGHAHRALCAAQVRLLDVCKPTGRLFNAAQNCLAQSRLALVAYSLRFGTGRRPCSANLSALPTASTSEALRRAGAVLNECLDSTPIDGSSR